MKITFSALTVSLVLATGTPAQQTDQATRSPKGAAPQTTEYVQATVDVFGFLLNRQFLYTHGPAVIGRDVHFTMLYTDHTPGTFFLMLGSEARPYGPFLSLYGGPFSQFLIGGIHTFLGPFQHDGIQTDFNLSIPVDPTLLGQSWYAQAIVTGGFVDLSSATGGVIGNYL